MFNVKLASLYADRHTLAKEVDRHRLMFYRMLPSRAVPKSWRMDQVTPLMMILLLALLGAVHAAKVATPMLTSSPELTATSALCGYTLMLTCTRRDNVTEEMVFYRDGQLIRNPSSGRVVGICEALCHDEYSAYCEHCPFEVKVGAGSHDANAVWTCKGSKDKNAHGPPDPINPDPAEELSDASNSINPQQTCEACSGNGIQCNSDSYSECASDFHACKCKYGYGPFGGCPNPDIACNNANVKACITDATLAAMTTFNFQMASKKADPGCAGHVAAAEAADTCLAKLRWCGSKDYFFTRGLSVSVIKEVKNVTCDATPSRTPSRPTTSGSSMSGGTSRMSEATTGGASRESEATTAGSNTNDKTGAAAGVENNAFVTWISTLFTVAFTSMLGHLSG